MATPSFSNNLGGYEYQFVEPVPDRYVCKICQHPSRDPYLSECCGHTFCKTCLEGAKKATAIVDACPVCRDEEFFTINNKQIDREVRSLHVFCTNKEKGCEWQGEVNDISCHLEKSNGGCQFEDVKCPNSCGEILQRQYLISHCEEECVCRKIDCQYCHITGEYQYIEGEHKEVCSKFPVPCPNKCKAYYVPREDISTHIEICPLQLVTCSSKCGVTLQRQYLTTHVETECPCYAINCQYCFFTGERQFIDGEHKDQCPKYPIACPNNCEIGSVTRDEIEKHTKTCPLEIIRCEYHMVGCKVKIARKDQKKHNKEMMEEHLSFNTRQLSKTQHNLSISQDEMVSSREEVITKITQTGIELASSLHHISSTQLDTMKTIDLLVQRLQQAEKDIATKTEITFQLENYKDTITTKLIQMENKYKKELEISRTNLDQELVVFIGDIQKEVKDHATVFGQAQHELKEGLQENQETIKKLAQRSIHTHYITLFCLCLFSLSLGFLGWFLHFEISKAHESSLHKFSQVEDGLVGIAKELMNTREKLTHFQWEMKKMRDEFNSKHRQFYMAIEEKLTWEIKRAKNNLVLQYWQSDLAIEKKLILLKLEIKNELHQRSDMAIKNFKNAVLEELKVLLKGSKPEQGKEESVEKKLSDFLNKLENKFQKMFVKEDAGTQEGSREKEIEDAEEEQEDTEEQQFTNKLGRKFQEKVAEKHAVTQEDILKMEQNAQIKKEMHWYDTIKTTAVLFSSGNQIVAPIIIKMSKYADEKQMMSDWFSAPFYSHLEGYKLCLNVQAAGFGKGEKTHLSVWVYLMRGPYDDQLAWPLKGHFKVTLLNQIRNSEHHTVNGTFNDYIYAYKRVIRWERSGYSIWRSHQFISHEDLENDTGTRQYLRDDSLFFEVNYSLSGTMKSEESKPPWPCIHVPHEPSLTESLSKIFYK